MYEFEDKSDDSVSIVDNVSETNTEAIEVDEDLGSSSGDGSHSVYVETESESESYSVYRSDSRSQSSDGWSEEPQNVQQVSSLSRLLMRYAIKYLTAVRKAPSVSRSTNSSKDYIDDIYKLINFNIRGKSDKSYDIYQIFTPDGKFWTYDGINRKASANINIKTSYSYASTFFPEPKESLWSVIRLAIANEGAIFYCINCGDTYDNLSSIEGHSGQCEFANLIKIESDQTERHSESYETREANLEIDCSKPFKERFFNWLSALIKKIRDDGHLQDESDESIFEQLKKDPNHNLTHYFNAVDMMIYQDKVFTVSLRDNFHKIFYDSRKITDEKDKSAAFRILEVETRKVVSINLLISIRDDLIKSEVKKCNYQGCLCAGEFETKNGDPKEIMAHILNRNFLVVCESCNLGFVDFELFERHLTAKCCCERPKKCR